jgi:S1-C subfamily serine protease
VEEFDLWKSKHSFQKHADMGAMLHVAAALLLAQIGEKDAAKKKCDEAAAFHSKNAYVRHLLSLAQRALTGKPGEEVPLPHGSGSGFCIAEDNYIMTNHHVIADAKQIMVHLNGEEERYPAHPVIDNPEGDMAVLKIDLPRDKKLVPIPFAAEDTKIGDEVCAFGWPALLSENSWATLTNGLVSGQDDREGFLVTNCKIEHGNSGGPLCSVDGCCIAGMVSRKTGTTEALDLSESYGLAIPASKLKVFLRDNRDKLPKDFFRKVPKVSRTSGIKLSEVVQRIQPSVVYVENYQ